MWLLLALFGLRFFGQGMPTHLAMTAMARWFDRMRGRAISIAGLGLPAAEALLPLAAVALVSLVGWRMTWVTAAAVLLGVSTPLLLAMLRDEPPRNAAPNRIASDANHGVDQVLPVRTQWTRAEVLKNPLFYALQPISLATSFIVTGIFFNQVALVESKGWELVWFAASFPLLAGLHVLSGLGTGWLVDRYAARRLLPGILIPLGMGTAMLTFSSSPAMLPAIMALLGIALGSSSCVQNALWAELFGTAHLGAIRALVMAGVVFASALSPALSGLGIDRGISLASQLLAATVYCALVSVGTLLVLPRLEQLVHENGA